MSTITAESPEVKPSAGRWSQDRRLEFIDFRLRWDGRLNRSDLTSFFGISVPQASLDIAKYLELAPQNAVYDRSERIYTPTLSFAALFPSNDAARYLDELLGRATGIVQAELSFLGWAPAAAVAPSPSRSVAADTLRVLLDAIRRESAVTVRYQSMTSVAPIERDIHPHALAHDGLRWHVRAYCHSRNQFLDFVIARFLDSAPSIRYGKSKGSADDHAWHRTVKLVLAPNPELSQAHRRVIELDYEMTGGQAIVECRQALVFYALKRLGLLDGALVPCVAQQIILKNRAEIEPLLSTTIHLQS